MWEWDEVQTLLWDESRHMRHIALWSVAAVVMLVSNSMAQEKPKAVVWEESVPGADAALTKAVSEAVGKGGYEVVAINSDALLKDGALHDCDLLVVPNARALPTNTVA